MHVIVKSLIELKSGLENLVIAISHPTDGDPWHEYGQAWERLTDDLAHSLYIAKERDPELRQSLFEKGMSEIAPSKALSPIVGSAPEVKVPEKLQKAYDFIKANKGKKALVIANHIGVSHARFRSAYVPKLRAMGVRNDRQGGGYYVDSE